MSLLELFMDLEFLFPWGLFQQRFPMRFGGFLGVIAGYFGGWIDSVITRIADTLMCIPGVLFLLYV